MAIQPIEPAMWPAIHRLETLAYSEIAPESLDTLRSRWLASPSTCFAYLVDHEVAGYVLAHAWDSHNPPKLFQPLEAATSGDYLFVHDLVVAGEHAGAGIGRQLAEHLLERAEQSFQQALLVSVQNSQPFWAKFGFQARNDHPLSASYGDNAVFMVRDFTAN